MQDKYLRRVFFGATLCVLGGAIAGGMACSSAPRKIPSASGAAGSSATGAAGSGTGAAGSGTGAAGSTGAAGDSSGAAGMTTGAAGDTSGTAGSATGIGGTTGAAGDASGAAGSATGAAGAAPTDNGLKIAATFPVPVTMYWYPSGWDGDGVTKAAFTANPASVIKIEDQSTATTGPCSKRVAGHVGSCFRVTYTPVTMDGGAAGNASVALIPNLPGSSNANFSDVTMAPHVPVGATTITAEVAGDKGGESVSFNLWDAFQTEVFMPTLTADQAWQKLSVQIPAGYDQELSPFGWGSASTTPIVFYYDDVRINNN